MEIKFDAAKAKEKKAKEQTLEDWCADHARKSGYSRYKFVTPGRRGASDSLFLGEDDIFIAEFKRTKNDKPSKLQQRFREALDRAGIDNYIVSDKEVFRQIIEARTK